MSADMLHRWTEYDERVFQDMRRWLADFTYKPGWRFDLERSDFGSRLIIKANVPDSRDLLTRAVIDRGTGEIPLIPVVASYYIATEHADSEERFWEWVRRFIIQTEKHEVDEWFRVRGELIYDPHEVTKHDGTQRAKL